MKGIITRLILFLILCSFILTNSSCKNKETMHIHTFDDWVEEIPATCLESGIKGHKACLECNKLFDKDDNEITDLSISLKGHDYKLETIEPTCLDKGYDEHTCLTCGYFYIDNFTDAKGHDYETDAVLPTCASEGYTIHTCKACEYSYKDNPVDTLDHEYFDKTVLPTCTTDGYTRYTCINCLYSYDGDIVPATGHNFQNYDIVKNPTCLEEGIKLAVCENENCETKDTISIPALGHSFTTYTVFIEPSCGDGVNISICDHEGCTMCDLKIVEGSAIEGMSHEYIDNHEGMAVCANCKHKEPIFEIVDDKFYDLTEVGRTLTSIFVPSTHPLDEFLFYGCENLIEVTLDENCVLASCLIRDCPNLERVIFSGYVETVSNHLVLQCDNLKEIIFNGNVGTIEQSLFLPTSVFERIVFHGSVKKIEYCAFGGDYFTGYSIEYDGTMEEWINISKGDKWNYYMHPDSVIKCSNGILSVNEEVIERF